MIFPSLTLERFVQVEDKVRFDASRCFTSGFPVEEITDVLIRPEATESFISVFNTNSKLWFLDWAYLTEGEKTITIRVETDVTPTGRELSFTMTCFTEEEDSLFSIDYDLFLYENDLIKYLPQGKNSFKFIHRKAQERIIAYLDEQRIWRQDGSRYSKQDIAQVAILYPEIREQFKQWSTFETLLIIFESFQVSNNDIFQEKKNDYIMNRNSARKRSALRLDENNDGTLDSQPYDIRTLRLLRR